MLTQKVQITLTPEEVAALSIKSKALGYNVTKYIKFIVSSKAQEVVEHYPTYKMPTKMEKKVLQAIADRKVGKTVKLNKVEDLLAI
ncbi:hypothetical protein COS52_01090 [Candidatus Roizmanbacteria bacterium CG03_land_8_20_14_0_80_39_12]|uniref:Uncharacterized protein n=1 Tax=Candidatus Roizmanbacteria bacterium CG03_land_8_20_14_0_80_39_12 TaxID=1974847 RepID=A0A2M7BTE8_9BACT|nr:MAG: hypothetical protein COS52_01090 [Candidatus Roizmanbacteria bacterium CG03_land_8_20_14_0_80_39_12]